MEEFESKVRERIDKLIQVEGLSQTEFAKKIGVNSANLNQVILGKRHVQKNLPSKIVAAFPEVRIEWILYGEGEMYKGDQNFANTKALREHVNKLPTRPRLPRTLDEGHIEDYFGEGKKRELCKERPRWPFFPEYDFSLMLKSERMYPRYLPGDELFFKKVEFPEWGSAYLVDCDGGPKFKIIYPDKMTIEKDGKEVEVDAIRFEAWDVNRFPSFCFPRSIVHGFYKCVGSIRVN